MQDHPDTPLTRSQRRAERLARAQQIEQRYRKNRQRNVLAQPGRHSFTLVLDHLKPGFNVPKIFRSAQAFGGTAVHLVDIGVFDPAPSYRSLREAGYTLYALNAGSVNRLPDVELPKKSAFVIGNEEFGLSFDPADYPDIQTLAIPLQGGMESLNASIAASIVMYEYVRQHADPLDSSD